MKKCVICEETKPITEFYAFQKYSARENRMKSYTYNKCKQCYHVKQRGPKKQKRIQTSDADKLLADMVSMRW